MCPSLAGAGPFPRTAAHLTAFAFPRAICHSLTHDDDEEEDGHLHDVMMRRWPLGPAKLKPQLSATASLVALPDRKPYRLLSLIGSHVQNWSNLES